MTPRLHVAGPDDAPVPSVAQRIQALQAQARQLAAEHVQALTAGMSDLAQTATEIAELGDVVPPGVRDLARRLAEDLGTRAANIESISWRAS